MDFLKSMVFRALLVPVHPPNPSLELWAVVVSAVIVTVLCSSMLSIV